MNQLKLLESFDILWNFYIKTYNNIKKRKESKPNTQRNLLQANSRTGEHVNNNHTARNINTKTIIPNLKLNALNLQKNGCKNVINTSKGIFYEPFKF